MAVSIEEAKQFIADADKGRSDWLTVAEHSWREIKKRTKQGKLWSMTPNSVRRRSRYPAWYSIFKIRQPLLLSRIGVPIGKDTTQDGNDNVGATAAMCLERLAINLGRSFNLFDVLCSARDDFLATNFGLVRAYYERDEVTQEVKEYITPQKVPGTEEVQFVDGAGKIVVTDNIMQDDDGYFIEHEETVDVENERVCLEHVLYKDVYIDPDIKRWARCRRVAFAEYYSVQEFKEIFGASALTTLPKDDDDESAKKRQRIKVFEYWDGYEKDVYWFADGGSDFIKPVGYLVPEGDEDGEAPEGNGLYDLEHLFPVPEPVMWNCPTDEFWPVPEYYQVIEILEDIHTIFSRMVTLTRAIRTRLLFDNNIDGLQEALNEAAEADAFGVSNLAQALAAAGGTLAGVVQYIPVTELIGALAQLYTALEQRLNVVYKLTGTSDLLQGLITDPSQRTLGERQMTEKYALNQIAEPQRKMQEFVRGCYQLLCEMALKNFKDASLDMYIMPKTLPPEHQARYRAAIGMLKENHKRFRIELETDSTIALNEEYDKKMRVEMVNSLTTALEKTANIAGQSPALVVPELHCLKFLVQGFRQGKMFQSEITQAIDNVIKQIQSAPAPFNKEAASFDLEQKKFQLEVQKANAKATADNTANQIDAFRANQEVSKNAQLLALQKQKQDIDSQISLLTFDLQKQEAGVEMQNKVQDNERLTAQLAFSAQRAQEPRTPQVVVVPPAQPAPVVVAPQPAPQPGPTIINTPAPAPAETHVVPVPVIPRGIA